ncbi:MAG: FeoB-associated Cys-rich membrane protein [Treponema sp.]|nr:FeoB-associated Cys-rich membrane protein [Treponema sp.]
MGTLFVSLILIAVIAAVIASMIKTKRSSGHIVSCGGNCTSCSGACHCKNHSDSVETPFVSEDRPLKIR